MSHWKAKQTSGALINEEGHILSAEEAQEKIRASIERTGRFILGSPIRPAVGEIADYAGLPMRVIRFVSPLEAHRDWEATQDIWGAEEPGIDGLDFFFEVEVAD